MITYYSIITYITYYNILKYLKYLKLIKTRIKFWLELSHPIRAKL